MKKKFIMLLICAIPLFSQVVYASIDQVNEFLDKYGYDDGVFETEEFVKEDNSYKTLLIRISEDSKKDNSLISEDEENIITELAKNEWFDYKSICCVSLFDCIPSRYSEYSVNRNVRDMYMHSIFYEFPWLPKEKDDLSEEEIRFLGRVSEKILQENWNDQINLKIGEGGEDSISILAAGGAAVVNGICSFNGKEYDFTVEFTYKMGDELNGDYETIYVGANDVDLYGEYKEIENIQLN